MTSGEETLAAPPPPPFPGGEESASVAQAAPAGSAASFAARVVRKRTYGNRLFFLDVQPDAVQLEGQELPDNPKSAELPGAEGARQGGSKPLLEVVFSFEVYGAEVRKIRKDVCAGDRVSVIGSYRSCGRILDATSYRILQRWRDANDGVPFNPASYGFENVAERSKSFGFTLPPESEEPDFAEGKMFCRFYVNNKSCQRPGCDCEHPDEEELKEVRRRFWNMQKQKKKTSANPDDPHSIDGKKSHAQRAAVYADWLCSVFGLENLKRDGVVDIAGGRGELAFELAVKRQIPCVTVDPRCPGDEFQLTRWEGFKVSKPQRTWLEQSVPKLSGYPECQAYVASCPLRQCRGEVTASCASPESERHEWWRAAIGTSHAIVGLHPDQATGGIVELAVAFGRAFAVVPCCTFADDFPERLLTDRPVRTYEDLVEWLRTRSDGTEVGFLGFMGKNLVVSRPHPSVGCAEDVPPCSDGAASADAPDEKRLRVDVDAAIAAPSDAGRETA